MICFFKSKFALGYLLFLLFSYISCLCLVLKMEVSVLNDLAAVQSQRNILILIILYYINYKLAGY